MTASALRRLWGGQGVRRRLADAATPTPAQLRAAMAGAQFSVHYQPEVELPSGAVVGVEALVRWSHPNRGLLTPGAFVPQMEAGPLIVPFGRWILHEACTALARLRVHHPDLRMNVNVSARQLSDDPGLVEVVTGELAAAGVAPGSLTLEITETALMRDRARCRDALQALRRAGVQVAIDDFGTGYSSLTSLTDLPASILKLDKGFVDALPLGGRHTEIVRCVLDMAHSLGMTVTAEGIETPRQAQLLSQLGCATGQGYYFSRPVPEQLLVSRLNGAFAGLASAGAARVGGVEWLRAGSGPRFAPAVGCASPLRA